MNKSKQEEIYSEIMKFYSFAEELLNATENNELNPDQLEIIENLIENIEKSTDNLTSEYIDLVENEFSYISIDSINHIFDMIIAKIEETQIKIQNN
jgi:hypothetical protein